MYEPVWATIFEIRIIRRKQINLISRKSNFKGDKVLAFGVD